MTDLGMRQADIAHQDTWSCRQDPERHRVRARRPAGSASCFGLEAATLIENELDRLDILYGFGVRQIGIAYSEANMLGAGLKEPATAG